jgi:hypothetical protein
LLSADNNSKMNLSVIIVLCLIITLVLILFPLLVSRIAEKKSKDTEWDKIIEFGKKINKRVKEKQNKLNK